MARLPDLDPAALSAAQRKVYAAILQGPRGRVEGPLRVWIKSPELADRAQALGAFCRYGTALPARLSELAIITVGAHWRAGFEWYVHAPLAEGAGVKAASIAAIKAQNPHPPGLEPDERTVYEFTHQLLNSRQVDQRRFEAAVADLGEVGVVDLVGIVGYYMLICMTIVAFDVETPGSDPFD